MLVCGTVMLNKGVVGITVVNKPFFTHFRQYVKYIAYYLNATAIGGTVAFDEVTGTLFQKFP